MVARKRSRPDSKVRTEKQARTEKKIRPAQQVRKSRRMRILPTPAGWCALAIALIALGIPRPSIDSLDPRPFVGVVLLLALLGEAAMLLTDRKGFAADVTIPSVLRSGEEGTVHVSVADAVPNQRVRYLNTHELDEDGHTSFDVQPRQRGIFRLRDLFLEDTGPIGLLRRSRRIDAPNDQMVCVGPKRQLLSTEVATINTVAAKASPVDAELDRLRAYVSGDDVRLLNWRSTARTGQPMVEVHQPHAIDPTVVIDLGPNEGPKAEAWASVAAGALQRLLEQGSFEVRSRDAQGEMTRTITNDRQIDIVLGSAVTGEPVALDGANLYIGAWRNDLGDATREGVHVISDTSINA
jgi:uncharacterized protein (DUF58 family)